MLVLVKFLERDIKARIAYLQNTFAQILDRAATLWSKSNITLTA